MVFFGKGGLTAEQTRSLDSHLGRRARILAVASGEGVIVAGLPDRMCRWDGESWSDLGWHEITRGGWDADAETLTWVDAAGVEHRLPLTDPGRLPELFKERVEATILLQRPVNVGAGRAAMVHARRNLGDPDAGAVWSITAAPGVLSDPAAVSRAKAELLRLRAEYEF